MSGRRRRAIALGIGAVVAATACRWELRPNDGGLDARDDAPRDVPDVPRPDTGDDVAGDAGGPLTLSYSDRPWSFTFASGQAADIEFGRVGDGPGALLVMRGGGDHLMAGVVRASGASATLAPLSGVAGGDGRDGLLLPDGNYVIAPFFGSAVQRCTVAGACTRISPNGAFTAVAAVPGSTSLVATTSGPDALLYSLGENGVVRSVRAGALPHTPSGLFRIAVGRMGLGWEVAVPDPTNGQLRRFGLGDTITANGTLPLSHEPHAVAAMDADGDGVTDSVFVGARGALLRLDSSGTVTELLMLLDGNAIAGPVALGDADADGRPDVVFPVWGQQLVYVCRTDPGGVVRLGRCTVIDTGPFGMRAVYAAAVGRLRASGLPSLVVAGAPADADGGFATRILVFEATLR